MRSTNLSCQPLKAEVRPIADVSLLWWMDSSIHFFQSLFYFHAAFLLSAGLSFVFILFLFLRTGGALLPFLSGLHYLAHLLALHHNFFSSFSLTALNFLSVILSNEITARAVRVDVVDTRMSTAQGAAINILSVSCGRETLKRCLRTWFLSPSERSDVGLNFCTV